MNSPTFDFTTRPRQRHPRVPIAARVIRYDESRGEWQSTNISESGLFVRGAPMLDPGTEIEIGVWLPTGDDDSVEVISSARVVWNTDPSSGDADPCLPLGMGLELIDITPEERRILQTHLYGDHPSGPQEEVVDLNDLLEVGVIIGSYRVIDLIGSGGMGDVYLGEHIRLGRRVALKRLHDRHARNPITVRRFFEEGRVVNRVKHKNVVEITDFITEGNDKCYVMELLDGDPLVDLIANDGPLEISRALHIGAQVCDALAAVHAAGVVHRDLKPGNVIIIEHEGERDHVKLVDFGIAKADQPEHLRMHRTAPGTVVGTPAYMSPEQGLGEIADHRSDIYAFGVLVYLMVTGRLVFEAASWSEVLIKHVTEPPLEPSRLRPEIPPELEAVILSCLEKKPADRPQSAEEIAARLREIELPGAADRAREGRSDLLPFSGFSSRTRLRVAQCLRRARDQITVVRRWQAWTRSPAVRLALLLAATVTLTATVTGILVRSFSPRSDAPEVVAELTVDRNSYPPQAPQVAQATPEPASTDNTPATETTESPGSERDADHISHPPQSSRDTSEPRRAKRQRRRSAGAGVEADIFLDADEALARVRKLVRTGYVRLAIRACRQALETNAGDPRFHRVLGVAYTLVQNKRMACLSYQRYLRYAPQAQDRDQVERILEGC